MLRCKMLYKILNYDIWYHMLAGLMALDPEQGGALIVGRGRHLGTKLGGGHGELILAVCYPSSQGSWKAKSALK